MLLKSSLSRFITPNKPSVHLIPLMGIKQNQLANIYHHLSPGKKVQLRKFECIVSHSYKAEVWYLHFKIGYVFLPLQDKSSNQLYIGSLNKHKYLIPEQLYLTKLPIY
jgi:hypothetical protein